MRQSLFAGVSFVNVNAHQFLYEILRGIANVVPVRRIEFKFTYNSLVSSLLYASNKLTCWILLLE